MMNEENNSVFDIETELAFARSMIDQMVPTIWGPCMVTEVDQDVETGEWFVGMNEHGEDFCVDLKDFRESLYL